MDNDLIKMFSELRGKGYTTLEEASALELIDLAIIFYRKYSSRVCNYFIGLREDLLDSDNKEEKEFFDHLARLAVLVLKKELERQFQIISHGGHKNG